MGYFMSNKLIYIIFSISVIFLIPIISCDIGLDIIPGEEEYISISNDEIKYTALSADSINGSDNSQDLKPGAIILYKTDDNRYGKFRVTGYEAEANIERYIMIIQWTTYSDDGSVFSTGDNLTIRGTWTCELDYGLDNGNSGADFWWEQETETERKLVPVGNALFAKYRY